jgi:hypothetical protein
VKMIRGLVGIVLGWGLIFVASVSVTSAVAAVPNMTCRAEGKAVGGPALHQYDTTDVFRFAAGKLYHRWSGREEYNDVSEVQLGRYVSGHMTFVLDYDNRSGYVVIASRLDGLQPELQALTGPRLCRMVVRPDLGTALATTLAHEARLDVGEPDIIGPAFGADPVWCPQRCRQ